MRVPRFHIHAVLCLAVLAGCRQDDTADSTEARRPNILLIVADDMGYTDLGSFGGEIRTPHLDELAFGGVRLTNFHVHPSCAPTRTALISGTYPHLAGMGTQLVTIARFNGDPLVEARRGKPGYEGHLTDRIVPIPKLLQDAGYRTYMVGKWHLGETPELSPAAQGFHRSFGLKFGSAVHFANVPAERYWEDGETLESMPNEFYSTDFYTDKFLSFFEESKENPAPWFSYMAYTSPHWPLQVPEDWLDKYEGKYDGGYDELRKQRIAGAVEAGVISEQARDKPAEPFARTWNSLSDEERSKYSRAMEIYASMVENLDYNVGRIVERLDETGELDNTVIVFMSDNGAASSDLDFAHRAPRRPQRINNDLENFGRPDSFVTYGPGWAQAGMGPYHLHKGTVASGGIRAAAFVNHSSVIRKGWTESAFLTVRDLSATLLDLAGVEHPGTTYQGRPVHELEGASFAPLLTEEGADLNRPDTVFLWEHDGQVALVKDNWKYSRLKSPHGPRGTAPGWQLYNMIDDPGETTDVSAEQPELVAEFKGAWERVASSGEMILYPE